MEATAALCVFIVMKSPQLSFLVPSRQRQLLQRFNSPVIMFYAASPAFMAF